MTDLSKREFKYLSVAAGGKARRVRGADASSFQVRAESGSIITQNRLGCCR